MMGWLADPLKLGVKHEIAVECLILRVEMIEFLSISSKVDWRIRIEEAGGQLVTCLFEIEVRRVVVRIRGQVLLLVCLSKLLILETVTLQAELLVLQSLIRGFDVCGRGVTILRFGSCGRGQGCCIECASGECGWVDCGIETEGSGVIWIPLRRSRVTYIMIVVGVMSGR